jgi:CTP:molybdopterin cytidylyltransferase MocA
MTRPAVLIFHRPATEDEPALVRDLAALRLELANRQAQQLQRAGTEEATFVTEWQAGKTFGDVLATLAPARGGVIVFGSGAVPLMNARDASRLVQAAGSGEAAALTNNRYSSDICAVGNAAVLRSLPSLPSDNGLPRWLEERAGLTVGELPGRDRMAMDIDTPLDAALVALSSRAPGWFSRAVADAGWSVPRREEIKRLADNPHAELLVFGRSSARTLRWLERDVRCRVRFLAEERGLRASSPLAIAASTGDALDRRPPRSTLGLLLDQRGPGALAEIVGELADGAVIDSRVLLAHRIGSDEAGWPPAGDRYASDLLLPDEIRDPWLRDLTSAAAGATQPILLGAHTLVGPAVPLLLG